MATREQSGEVEGVWGMLRAAPQAGGLRLPLRWAEPVSCTGIHPWPGGAAARAERVTVE